MTLPSAGGSYIRSKDGKLELVKEATDSAVVKAPKSEPPKSEPLSKTSNDGV
jgi:hypothetical protein